MPTLPAQTPKKTRDLFAELYVAGALADAGWHIYFPKRDFGFDFIITKRVEEAIVRLAEEFEEIDIGLRSFVINGCAQLC